MKLVKHFNDFLQEQVNLNKTRIEQLERHVDSIQSFLKNSGYGAVIRSYSSQGSWAHKTIIKPLPGKEFDADLVMFVDPVDGWTPKDYVDQLYTVFCGSGIYRDKVHRNTRCVTLNYSGDFHLDVVPCVVHEYWILDKTYEICNRRDNKFELTAPEEYTKWLRKCNQCVGNNQLRKITRLIKFLRDHKGTFSAKSILLTTLLGNTISFLDGLSPESEFGDVPTSLRTIFSRLDDYLQCQEAMPVIRNPVRQEEEFNRHWDQKKYNNFRNKIHQYRLWIDDAYQETDRDESIRKWRRIFGDQFAKAETIDKASNVNDLALGEAQQGGDLVASVRKCGPSILETTISRSLPHVEASIWRSAGRDLKIQIVASHYDDRNGNSFGKVRSGEILEKNRWLRFEALQKTGLPFLKKDYRIVWRVVNTGPDAARDEGGLRGKFEKSESHAIRWESTKYHGAHWVEAFLISNRDNRLHGQSSRFFVVVD